MLTRPPFLRLFQALRAPLLRFHLDGKRSFRRRSARDGFSLTALLTVIALAGMLTACSGNAEAETSDTRPSLPNWAERYLAEEPEPWTEWRNSLAPEGEGTKLSLAQNGETDYVIVVPRNASPQEARAASELRLWLGKITGADFPVVTDATEPQPRELSVGTTNRLGKTAKRAKKEAGPFGYALVVEDERLFFLGGSGPLNAALAFLEEDLGVRWYTGKGLHSWSEHRDAVEAETWHDEGVTRLPEDASLTATVVPRTERPGIEMRRHTYYHFGYRPLGLRNRVNFGWDDSNGYQYAFADGKFAGHTFHRLVPPDKYFEDHPEYYSLIDGERRWKKGQLCLTNEDVVTIAANKAIEVLKNAPPKHRYISVSAMDNPNVCECDSCMKVQKRTGAYSGVVLEFVNDIAARVEKAVPDATIATLAYWQTRKPPEIDMRARDNVAVWLALDRNSSFDWPYHSYYDEKFADASVVQRERSETVFAELSEWELFERWREISPRLWFWMYPGQYRNTFAPMPIGRAIAGNLRFAAENGVEMVYMQSHSSDQPREHMKAWVRSKLHWNPGLDVHELEQDFIWGGYYGKAAAEVAAYNDLLVRHAAKYNDFERRRDWIYGIYDEGMFRHGFIEEAREILNRGTARAEDEDVRWRVKLLKFGVVYVDAAKLFVQMRDGETPPDAERYEAVLQEFVAMAEELEVEDMPGRFYKGTSKVNFYDGDRNIGRVDEFVNAMKRERSVRHGAERLPDSAWGAWHFRADPENAGVEKKWYADKNVGESEAWRSVPVPAHLSTTEVGSLKGFGWYHTTLDLTEGRHEFPVELRFEGVDEQAWVYVNGHYIGEHTLESEHVVGQAITVKQLWDRPFSIKVPNYRLNKGENHVFIRIHNSEGDAGIHDPVSALLYSPDKE